MRVRAFAMKDYDEVRALWAASGLEFRPGDSKAEVRRKVTRDPELFLVAVEDGRIVGTVMGAWDGRRGWIYHLGVLPEFQRRGVASAMVVEVEERMRRKGVLKSNAAVFEWNDKSKSFFESMGYSPDLETVKYGKWLTRDADGDAAGARPRRAGKKAT